MTWYVLGLSMRLRRQSFSQFSQTRFAATIVSIYPSVFALLMSLMISESLQHLVGFEHKISLLQLLAHWKILACPFSIAGTGIWWSCHHERWEIWSSGICSQRLSTHTVLKSCNSRLLCYTFCTKYSLRLWLSGSRTLLNGKVSCNVCMTVGFKMALLQLKSQFWMSA